MAGDEGVGDMKVDDIREILGARSCAIIVGPSKDFGFYPTEMERHFIKIIATVCRKC